MRVTNLIHLGYDAADGSTSLGPRIEVFYVLQLVAFIFAIIVLLTVFFSSVARQATWYTFFISWAVFCFSYLLAFLAGQGHNPEPPVGLCVVQSSLTYAAPPFSASATLCLVAQVCFNIYSTFTGGTVRKVWNRIILVTPYIVFVFVLFESLTVALIVEEARFSTIPYCSQVNIVPGRVTAVLVILLIIPVLVLNVIVYKKLRRHSVSTQTTEYFRSMFIRITLFSLFGGISVILCLFFFFIVFVKDSKEGQEDLNIVLACLPNAAVFIFGTHEDLIRIWMFWKKQ